MITDYKIVSAIGGAQLAAEVKKEIAAGWQPIGGVTVVRMPDPNYADRDFAAFIQAMVLAE